MSRRLLLAGGIGLTVVAVAWISVSLDLPVIRLFGFFVLEPMAMLASLIFPRSEAFFVPVLCVAWVMWSLVVLVALTLLGLPRESKPDVASA